MEQQQRMHIKEPVKESLFKQAAITKGVDISNLRHSSNAEAHIDRISSMLRSSDSRNNGVNARGILDLVMAM